MKISFNSPNKAITFIYWRSSQNYLWKDVIYISSRFQQALLSTNTAQDFEKNPLIFNFVNILLHYIMLKLTIQSTYSFRSLKYTVHTHTLRIQRSCLPSFDKCCGRLIIFFLVANCQSFSCNKITQSPFSTLYHKLYIYKYEYII